MTPAEREKRDEQRLRDRIQQLRADAISNIIRRAEENHELLDGSSPARVTVDTEAIVSAIVDLTEAVRNVWDELREIRKINN